MSSRVGLRLAASGLLAQELISEEDFEHIKAMLIANIEDVVKLAPLADDADANQEDLVAGFQEAMVAHPSLRSGGASPEGAGRRRLKPKLKIKAAHPEAPREEQEEDAERRQHALAKKARQSQPIKSVKRKG